MKRGVEILWVALMVAGAVVTYSMKDNAGRAADRVHKLRADIASEQEAITLLKAEWSVLDQPARLQELVGRYPDVLKLQPIDVRQLATVADIPDKPPVPSAEVDPMRTSSIGAAAAKTTIAAEPTTKPGAQP